MMVRLARAFLACFWVMAICVSAGAEHRVDGELALEQRLMAPCCWVQTLDVHESPVAQDLRTEIHRRLGAGEPAAQIEADLVSRYGDRIRAMPPGNPLAKTASVVAFGVAVAAILLVLLMKRWIRRQRAVEASEAANAPAKAAKAPERDEYDDKLDEQLRKMD
jgi:cytochrome c-type biogenesis protein CcmH